MNITPEQIGRIGELLATPDETDSRAPLDVEVHVAPVEWEASFRDELPGSSVYARITWAPDDGPDGPPHCRVSRLWLLDSAGEQFWSSGVRTAGEF